jgi:hypothetical protein
VTFTPNTHPGGISKKLSKAVLPVTVVDSDGHCGGGTQTCVGTCPPTGENPAAPAVANSYLNGTDSATLALVAACRNVPAFKKNNWHGVLISYVANTWMPKPESVKDDPSWGTGTYDTWVAYVDTEVEYLCNHNSGTDAVPPPSLHVPAYTHYPV